jgi:hypothetical protein
LKTTMTPDEFNAVLERATEADTTTNTLTHGSKITSTFVAFHQEVFTEVCVRGGFYMASFVADKHGLTMEELKSHCLVAGKELEAQGKLLIFQLPTYRWASDD